MIERENSSCAALWVKHLKPQVMSEMPLSQQMEWCRKEERQENTDGFIHPPVAEQHPVLGFMNRRVNGVHDDRERDDDEQQT